MQLLRILAAWPRKFWERSHSYAPLDGLLHLYFGMLLFTCTRQQQMNNSIIIAHILCFYAQAFSFAMVGVLLRILVGLLFAWWTVDKPGGIVALSRCLVSFTSARPLKMAGNPWRTKRISNHHVTTLRLYSFMSCFCAFLLSSAAKVDSRGAICCE